MELLAALLTCLTPVLAVSELSGLLAAGGFGDSVAVRREVELWLPGTGQQCSLPSLPNERVDHTLDGTTLCGGLMVGPLRCRGPFGVDSEICPMIKL